MIINIQEKVPYEHLEGETFPDTIQVLNESLHRLTPPLREMLEGAFTGEVWFTAGRSVAFAGWLATLIDSLAPFGDHVREIRVETDKDIRERCHVFHVSARIDSWSTVIVQNLADSGKPPVTKVVVSNRSGLMPKIAPGQFSAVRRAAIRSKT